ncbi:MAG: sulfatase [Acidobacteriota bacterium]
MKVQTRAALRFLLLPLALALFGYAESLWAHGWLAQGLGWLALSELGVALRAGLAIALLVAVWIVFVRSLGKVLPGDGGPSAEVGGAVALAVGASLYRLGLRNWNWPLPAQLHHVQGFDLSWPESWGARHVVVTGVVLVLFVLATRWLGRSSESEQRVAAPRGTLVLLLAALLLGLVLAGLPSASPGPDVLLITVDTLRADSLGFAGSTPSTTPRLDKVAARGVVFDRAYAPASWTLPSLASLLTGLRPSEHGATGFDTPLDRRFTSVAEVFKNRGYQTVGVTSHLLSSRRYGLAQGFDVYADRYVGTHREISSQRLTNVALERLRKASNRPLFLWVHYFDPHSAYVDHPDRAIATSGRFATEYLERDLRGREVSSEELAHVLDLYREEIATTDDQIGRLLDEWLSLRPGRESLVAFTSDHGELFGEHDLFGHGYVQEEVLRVPLMLWSSAFEADTPSRRREAVSTLSLPATLLDLADLTSPEFSGPGLFEASRLPLLLEAASPGREKASYSVLDWPHKYVLDVRSGDEDLYDLEYDPGETTDLLPARTPEEASLARDLRAFLERRLPRIVASTTRGLTASERESLESLGYLE